jgi:glycosyltransferase involved in cell wall biosynthesis
MIPLNKLKVALVHDWLTGMRGGEKVLEIFAQLFPAAPIFTLLHNQRSVSSSLESHPIFTSFVDRLPLKKSKYRHYLPLFPLAIEQFNLKDFQLILSTSHCAAKGIITPPDALHISYIHTPMRYVWDMYHDYFGSKRSGWLARKIIPLFAHFLRTWDVSSSNRVDWFIANSRHVARRIKKYYGREASVIYPPVDTSQFQVSHNPGKYFLVVSALVPYKKTDLAISAFNQLGEKLVVVGNGPELRKLKRKARANIEFVSWQSPQNLASYYSECKALIFPGEEDFGMVPVEAMACGKPVIAFARGGALETVIEQNPSTQLQSSGVYFYQQTAEGLIQAVKSFNQLDWDPEFISRHARNFDKSIFQHKMVDFIQEKCNQFFASFQQSL